MHSADESLADALNRLGAVREDLVRELTAICEIPAPTFQEGRRAEHVAERMRQIGLSGVEIDAIGNVVGRLKCGDGPVLMVAAHIDTVFPVETDVQVQRLNGRLTAPGVGDNAASVACMLQVAQTLKTAPFDGEVIFACPVGEEGNGDLRGMRKLVTRFKSALNGVVAVDGKLGGIVTRAVGSRRYRIRVFGPGGHSWGDFGRPSATHILGCIVARLSALEVPPGPRTTFNVGTIRGGTSVNTIAAAAEAEVDLRSIDPAQLRALDGQAREAIASVEIPEGARVDVENIGDRPAGATPENSWISQAARQALRKTHIDPVMTSSSTDANVPMAEGIPAVCFGVYRGGGAHTLAEHVEIDSLTIGARALLLLIRGALDLAPPLDGEADP